MSPLVLVELLVVELLTLHDLLLFSRPLMTKLLQLVMMLMVDFLILEQIFGKTGSVPSILRYLKLMAQVTQPTQVLRYLVVGAGHSLKNLCPFFPEVIMVPVLLITVYFPILELTITKHLYYVILGTIGNPPCYEMDLLPV